MAISENDKWFSSLTVKQKEHIGVKVAMKSGVNAKEGLYPNCTKMWNTLDAETKQKIHEHCTDSHGMFVIEYNKTTAIGHDF